MPGHQPDKGSRISEITLRQTCLFFKQINQSNFLNFGSAAQGMLL